MSINKYIEASKGLVKPDFRQSYHMMPPVGWMNDPNGLVYFQGMYHLFYQYNPYDSCPGTMIWGHFISKDLVRYEDAGAAIVPQDEHVSIFSGGAIVADGKLVTVYAEHFEDGGEKREEIYSSSSEDGMVFDGRKKLFDNGSLPDNLSRTDFRDPYPVCVDGRYYVFVGGKDVTVNKGVLVVLGGDSLDSLEYLFTIGPYDELGDMGECPSWKRIDGKDVILVCGCRVPQSGNSFRNENSSVFIVGDLDFEAGTMNVDFIREIDKGDCFYAPQFINGTDDAVMIGWQEMWGKPYPTQSMGCGWVGGFSIPRRICLKNGQILQVPVEALDEYLRPYDGAQVPQTADIEIEFAGNASVTLEGLDGSVTVGLADGRVYLDTLCANNENGCIRYTDGEYEACRARVLLDVSGIEVFVEGGREAISSRMYIIGDFSCRTEGDAKVVSVRKVEL